MPSSYPSAIDSFATPLTTDNLGTSGKQHTVQHEQVNSAVNKIETELGVNPKGSATSVAARLTSIESSITTAASTVSGSAATLRNYTMQTLGVNRWTLTANATAEGGSNAGSDFEIRAWNDAGSVLTGTGVLSGSSTGAVLRVTRSNGAVALGGSLTVAGATSISSTLTVSGSNATALGGTLTVTGNAQFNGTLTVASGQTTTLGTRVDAGSVTYATTPVGVIAPYAGDTAPNGWLLCDGSAVSRTTYSALFGIVATKYGTGDGSTTFNVPDLRARAPFGYKSADANFGATSSRNSGGGSATSTLTTNELPAHTHTYSLNHTHASGASTGADGSHNHSTQFSLLDGSSSVDISNVKAGSMTSGRFVATINSSGVSNHTHTIPAISYTGTGTSDSAGTGAAFSNLPPYVVVNYIIKY